MDKNIESFYEELEETLNLIKNQLLLTFEIQSKKTKENYNCLFQNNLLDDEKLETNNKIRKIIKNGTLNIDIVGLKESSTYLSKKNSLIEFDISNNILSRIRELCDNFADETKLNFVVSISNTLSSSRKLLAIDKTVFGIIENVTDKDTYKQLDYDIDQSVKCQTYLNGGYLVEMNLTSKDSYQKVYDMIKLMEEKGIGVASFRKKARE
jgi:ribonucleoside-triphosphate reductase